MYKMRNYAKTVRQHVLIWERLFCMLLSERVMGWQRVGHYWANENNNKSYEAYIFSILFQRKCRCLLRKFFWDYMATELGSDSLRNGRNITLKLYSSILVDWRRPWHPTPVLLPGKSHGRRSLVGCSPWGR